MNAFATYDFMKEVNVGGLKSLLRFASSKRNKTLEYVSTIEILNAKGKVLKEDISLYAHTHYKTDGYASTKYVAEKICEIARERGVDVSVYRLGLITGDTHSGKNDSSQWFQQLLEAGMKLSSLFSVESFRVPVTPVNFVTKSIVALSNDTQRNHTYHVTNNSSLKLDEMLNMYNEGDSQLELVSMHTFIQSLKAYNATHGELAITAFFEKYLHASDEVLEAIQAEAVEAQMVNTDNTLEALNRLGIHFPEIDKQLIQKYFNASASS
jgi:thioester reductase-like protein